MLAVGTVQVKVGRDAVVSREGDMLLDMDTDDVTSSLNVTVFVVHGFTNTGRSASGVLVAHVELDPDNIQIAAMPAVAARTLPVVT